MVKAARPPEFLLAPAFFIDYRENDSFTGVCWFRLK
jgi:hypothetical protein